jgi:hypothetical protein
MKDDLTKENNKKRDTQKEGRGSEKLHLPNNDVKVENEASRETLAKHTNRKSKT